MARAGCCGGLRHAELGASVELAQSQGAQLSSPWSRRHFTVEEPLNDRCYKKAATKSEGSRHGVSHGAGRRGVGAGR